MVDVAQGGLLHWGLGLKDGPSMNVSVISRSFATPLSPRESCMVSGYCSSYLRGTTSTASTRRSHSKRFSRTFSWSQNSLYSVGSKITTILR